ARHVGRCGGWERRFVDPVVVALDSHAACINDLGPIIVTHHRIEKLDALPGSGLDHLDRQRTDRNGADQLDGEAGQMKGVLTGTVIGEEAAAQYHRGAAVHGIGIPRARAQRCRTDPIAVPLEECVAHRATLERDRPSLTADHLRCPAMGLDDLLGDFGDDLGKAKDLADQLWDDRDKISEAVTLVWDNKDELAGVLDFVRDHGDDLLDLLKKVPDILGQAGDGLTLAGSSAVQAGGWLVDEKGGVAKFAEIAADAIEACLEQLGKAVDLLADLGDEIDGISIPSFEPKFSDVMGFSVVTGLDIGEMSLTDQAAGKIRSGSEQLDGIAGNLAGASDALRALGGKVADAGGELESVGLQLHDSGQTLTTVTGSGKKKKPPKTAKRASAKARPKAKPKPKSKSKAKKGASRSAKKRAKKGASRSTKRTRKTAAKKTAAKRATKKTTKKQATTKKLPSRKAAKKTTKRATKRP
ncbi:MAG: hypothetical protein AAGE94_25595, partial [Acidobacteriota bacterium]